MRLAGGLTICLMVAAVLLVVMGKTRNMVQAMGKFWLISLGLMLVMRMLLLLVFWYVKPRLRPRREVLILGTGKRAWEACHELLQHPDIRYEVLGFLDSHPQDGYVPEEMILGGTGDLESLLAQRVVDEVVIALPVKSQYEVIGRAVAICQELGIQAQYSTDQFGTSLTKRRYSVGPQRARMVLQVVHHDYRRHLKRAADILGALFGLIVLSPMLLLVALLVKVTSPGPILFRQERFGRNKRRFAMLKFRSMVVNAEALQAQLEHLNEIKGPTFKIKKDPRITPIGTFLRKMSIDELPQLLNVLKGDMSLVGPRPLPTRDVSRFSDPWLLRRFSVMPGLTCLWQVSGRSNTDFEQWIDLDLQYIDNWSLTLDFVILLKTIPAVLKGRGAS
jgi:exopolysaccharide biosynthesis polyprenyl glycosylphosphotransferase